MSTNRTYRQATAPSKMEFGALNAVMMYPFEGSPGSNENGETLRFPTLSPTLMNDMKESGTARIMLGPIQANSHGTNEM